MAWIWTAAGVCGVVAGVLTLAAAVTVYAASPQRLQNRLLASFLALNAATLVAGYGLMYLTTERAETYAWQMVALVVGGVPYLCLYPAFLSTLPTPIAPLLARTRPFLYACAILLPALVLAKPEKFIGQIVPGTLGPWDVLIGPWWAVALYALLAVSLFGVALAIVLYARSRRGTLQRAQAKAYLAAFAILDLTYGGMSGLAPILGWTVWGFYVSIGGAFAFVALLAYGMLKTQLFDLDIKLKWTLRRGTVVAIFVGVFLIVAQVAQEFLTGAFGWLAGGVAAGALLLALRPIERAADKLADRAMPSVRETPAYVAFRKMEVYKGALEEVLGDGSVSEKDRRVLERLRAQLGLSPEDARAMERDVADVRSGVA